MAARLLRRHLCAAAVAFASAAGAAETPDCRAGADIPAPMQLTASQVDRDPQHLWSDVELWSAFSPRKTDIWTSVVRLCDGSTFEVSQMVNRQCFSTDECPARAIVNSNGGSVTVLAFKQICTDHQRIFVSHQGRSLTACGIEYPLAR